jgi:dipeptidyl-peptidase-4
MRQTLLTSSSLLLLVLASCASDNSASSTDDNAASNASATTPTKLDGKPLPLERIFADPPLAGRPPMGVKFSRDGKRLGFLRASEADSEVTDLWALDLPGGEPKPLVKTTDLVKPDEIKLSEEEKMANERKRVRTTGITSWMWCGEGSSALLFPLSGDLYSVRIADEGPKVERLTKDGKAKLDPRCASDGSAVGYVQDGELFVLDVKKKKARKLTSGASETRRFGVAEFIAQEEMGRYEGYWFSPDAKRVAYTEVDTSTVSVKTRPLIHADKTEMYSQRYPAAGETNAVVKLHVRDLKGGRATQIKLPQEDGYLARVGFFDKDTLWVQWQTRDQKKLTLLAGTAPAYKLEPVVEETDEAWVDIDDDLLAIEDGKRFLWSSERSGTNQLYLHTRGEADTKPVQLTDDAEPVVAVVGVDAEQARVYYLRAFDRGRQQHLYSVPMTGGEPFRVTQEDGWHSIRAPRKLAAESALVDTYSRWGAPAKTRLIAKDGEQKRVLDDNPAEELATYAAPEVEWVDVKAADGSILNGLLLKPQVMRGAKAPVIVYTYGGPTVNLVTNRWGRTFALATHWTQQGFGVFILDNRGTSRRDRAFTRAHHNAFGVVEIEDQKRGVTEVLHKQSWVDPARIGIFGWSYGGYVTTMAMLDDETPFRAGAAVAPVTDWRLYDTHYTERYIGTPQTNADVYARSNALLRAKNLGKGERSLLLVHGMADDNVLFQHTLALTTALQRESIPFEFMAYPGAAHGIRGRNNQLHVFRTITRFFERELELGSPP